jgi:hypothetical protein
MDHISSKRLCSNPFASILQRPCSFSSRIGSAYVDNHQTSFRASDLSLQPIRVRAAFFRRPSSTQPTWSLWRKQLAAPRDCRAFSRAAAMHPRFNRSAARQTVLDDPDSRWRGRGSFPTQVRRHKVSTPNKPLTTKKWLKTHL